MCNLYCLSQYSFNNVQVFQSANILFVLKRCQGKLFIYTKTFGGKIWNNLHRVSPGNFVGKIFNKVC